MLIQINEGHIGQCARREDADRVIAELATIGWPVEYIGEGEPLWDFPDVHKLWAFESDFEDLRDRLWPALLWRVRWPCDCGAEMRESKCKCSAVNDPATNTTYIDYERANEINRSI